MKSQNFFCQDPPLHFYRSIRQLFRFALCLPLFFLAFATFAQSADSALESNSENAALNDGIYLVLESYANKPTVLDKPGEKLIAYDHRMLSENTDNQPAFLKISTDGYVPLVLQERPLKLMDSGGKKKLILSMAGTGVQKLSAFSEENTGKKIAIVINSHAVTIHKVQEKLDQGKIQITRCSDNACEYLFAELEDNIVN